MRNLFFVVMFAFIGTLLLQSCSKSPTDPSLGGGSSPTPIVTPVVTPSPTAIPTVTFSYAVTVANNIAPTGLINYWDGNGVEQNVTIPIGGISWAVTCIGHSGSVVHMIVNFNGNGSTTDEEDVYVSGSNIDHGVGCCGGDTHTTGPYTIP